MGRVNELKDLTRGQIDAALMKIGQDVGIRTVEGIRAFLRDELIVRSKPFHRNKHGHYVLTIVGRDLTGEQEIACMQEGGYCVSKSASQILTSTDSDGYDINHRLEKGREYNIVLVPKEEITERCVDSIEKYGHSFGYGDPLAGVIPRVCEVVSDSQMEIDGLRYIAALHDPIKDSNGSPCIFHVYRHIDSRCLHADWVYPGHRWDDNGAFAFFAAAS